MATDQNDLQYIRQIMERSSTFISLSGLSGVGAGIIAVLGCSYTFYVLHLHNIDYFDGKPNHYSSSLILHLGIVAVVTLMLALAAAIYFTVKKSKRLALPFWTASTKNVLIYGCLPLVFGGLFCLILISHSIFYLVAPCMLIFYGLAILSVSKYTQSEVFWLGILQVLLGLFASVFVGYGLLFWGIGFGILHIVYGIYMHIKYQ